MKERNAVTLVDGGKGVQWSVSPGGKCRSSFTGRGFAVHQSVMVLNFLCRSLPNHYFLEITNNLSNKFHKFLFSNACANAKFYMHFF